MTFYKLTLIMLDSDVAHKSVQLEGETEIEWNYQLLIG